jgi:hypothetical protein
MDSDRKSSLGQDVDIQTSVLENIIDKEIPAANHDSATANGHADASLNKTSKDLDPDVEIESSSEGEEERAEEGSAAHSVQADSGNGLQDVPLNHDKLSVSFFPPSLTII